MLTVKTRKHFWGGPLDQREYSSGRWQQWHKEHTGCIISLKGIILIVSVALKSFDLGSLCWLTFGRKSTVSWEIPSCLDLMPNTQSLKEDASKYQSVTVCNSIDLMPNTQSLKEDASKYQLVTVCNSIKANNTLKASKVGHCASWFSWLRCLQLWHKAYSSGVNDRQLFPCQSS